MYCRVTVCALLVAAVACSSGSKDKSKITRDRDAAAVVVVKKQPAGKVTYADEAEPNDEPSAPGEIALPGGVRGTLDGEKDVDRYRLTVTEPGWLAVELGGIAGVDLAIELQTSSGKLLARCDRGPAGTVEGFPNYAVAPGTYLLAVSEFVSKKRRKKGKPRTGESPVYSLSARLETADPAGHQEREPNDEPVFAGELELEQDGFGYVGWNGDADRWRLSFDQWGADMGLAVDVTAVADVRLQLELLDDNGDRVLSRRGGKGEAVAARNVIPREGHEHYYIRISGKGANPLERYSVRLTSDLLEVTDEREPNDGKESAMPLRTDVKESGGTRRGYLLAGDKDWYVLEGGAEPSLVTVKLTPPASVDPILTMLGASGGVVGEARADGKGVAEELSAIPLAAGGTLYVEVQGAGTAETIEPYELRWTVAPAAGRGAAPSYDPYEP